jgi:antagonist of KipI
MALTIKRAGFLTTVQDLGRTGFRQFGVSSGGALDTHALRVANLLVGNDEAAAGLEITLGGLQLRFADERIVSWCGGEFIVVFGSTALPCGHAALLRAGQELTIDRPKIGCRAWLAISGGINVPPVLESRSTDLRAGFGGFNGRALRNGDEIPLSENSQYATALIDKLGERTIASWKPAHDWSSPAKREPILRIIPGPDWTRFNDLTIQQFTTGTFIVSSESDRMGARLEGMELEPNDSANLISEAVAPGTVQVPPSGKPILLLGDCQTIGGYPKIAHVVTADLPIAAQLRAADQVRFRQVSLANAHQLLAEREHNLEQFRFGLQSHFS